MLLSINSKYFSLETVQHNTQQLALVGMNSGSWFLAMRRRGCVFYWPLHPGLNTVPSIQQAPNDHLQSTWMLTAFLHDGWVTAVPAFHLEPTLLPCQPLVYSPFTSEKGSFSTVSDHVVLLSKWYCHTMNQSPYSSTVWLPTYLSDLTVLPPDHRSSHMPFLLFPESISEHTVASTFSPVFSQPSVYSLIPFRSLFRVCAHRGFPDFSKKASSLLTHHSLFFFIALTALWLSSLVCFPPLSATKGVLSYLLLFTQHIN